MPGQSGGRGGSGRSAGSPLGGLVGAGPSIVGVSGALRARDVSRPTDEQLAAAERRDQERTAGSSPDRS